MSVKNMLLNGNVHKKKDVSEKEKRKSK